MANPYFLQGEKTVALLGNPYGLKCYRRKTSWFAFAIVALAHLSTVVAFRSQPQSVVPQTPPKPIMVSLVSEQPSMNNTPNLPSPPNQADQKPIKPKSKATKPNKIPHKAAKIIWPKERRVVEQKPSDQISTSEIKSKPLEKNVDISDKNAHTQGNSKPSNAEEKFQAPSFNAEYLNNPPPSYPSVSRRMGETGRILLRVMVSAVGVALSVVLHASSGSNRLDEAAITAVRKWRFVPAKRGGQAVSASVMVPIKFSLEG